MNKFGLGPWSKLHFEPSAPLPCSHSSDRLCGSTNNVSCVCAWATHSLPSRAPVYCGCPAGTHRCVTMSRVHIVTFTTTWSAVTEEVFSVWSWGSSAMVWSGASNVSWFAVRPPAPLCGTVVFALLHVLSVSHAAT